MDRTCSPFHQLDHHSNIVFSFLLEREKTKKENHTSSYGKKHSIIPYIYVLQNGIVRNSSLQISNHAFNVIVSILWKYVSGKKCFYFL